MKHTIAYLNVATLAETDITVLPGLSKTFKVHWFVIYEPNKNSSLSIEEIKEFARIHDIVLHVHTRTFRIRSYKNWEFYHNLYNDVVKLNPSVIYHCNVEFYWACFFLFNSTSRVVMGLHDVSPHSTSTFLFYAVRKLTNFFVRKVFKNHIVFSENQKKLYRKIYGKEVVNVGMSCKDFGDPTNSAPSFNNGVKLLFFGSISHYKGLDVLIETLESLYKEGFRNLTLTIAGKGNDKEWKDIYLPLIRTKELYNIQYRFVNSNEIPNLFNCHHFLVLPYRDATQSGPVLIAANYCIPIVAPAFGCFCDTYDNSSAILYPVGYLKDALIKLTKMTEKQYTEMKSNCAKIRDKNSEREVTKNYINYFDKIIEAI